MTTWKRIAVGLLALASVLGGCLGNDKDKDDQPDVLPPASSLSVAQYAILPPEETWVTASDGQRLHNAVYRPDTDEAVPVFINFSPYWGDSAVTEGDAFSQYMIHEYVPRGYAVVLAAIRGTGHSEGCFSIGGDRESQDLNEVVDFFSTQPWSNGNIAAGGKSYDSTSQNGMVAKFPHPALKGLFHVSGITDMYRYTMHDGVPYGMGSRTISFTASYYATQGLDEYAGATSGSGSATDEDADSIARAVDDAACLEAPFHVTEPVTSATVGAKTAYWQERDYAAFIGQSSWTGSIFFVHGLQDWNVQPDHIQPWMDEVLAKGDIAVLGWLHQWQQGGTGHVYPMRADWNETMLRWMDQVLKGKDTGLDQLYGFESQGTDGLFRRSATWPPTPPTVLPLGDLEVSCNATCSTQELPLLEADGQALRMAGSPVAHVSWQAQSPDPVLTAVLYKENGTGRHWVGEATQRGLYRDDLTTPSPVVVGTTYEADLAFYPLDAILEPGARWVVVFGAPTQQGTGVAATTALAGLPASPGDAFYVFDQATFTASILGAEQGLPVQQAAAMACFTC